MREAREEIEKIEESASRKRKPLVREDSFPASAPDATDDPARRAACIRVFVKAARERAEAEMFDLSDRFNTETEET